MMNTKHLAEYIIENSHEDADAKIVAQAYLNLLIEMEGKDKAIPDGMVLVPVEPTEEMLFDADRVDIEYYPHNRKRYLSEKSVIEIYKAMIKASRGSDGS